MRIAGKIIAYLSPIFISVALAQYPEKPIRLVVGFTAGGPTDLPARYIAERLGERLGQRVVVENRAGAGGQIATQDVLARPRDGYNLLLCTHFEGINLAIYRNAAYNLADARRAAAASRRSHTPPRSHRARAARGRAGNSDARRERPAVRALRLARRLRRRRHAGARRRAPQPRDRRHRAVGRISAADRE